MRDLLLEIGIEELPARFVGIARDQMVKLVQENLAQARLEYGTVEQFSTPRRLAVLVHQVADQQADLEQEVKGPPKQIAFKDGAPTKAAQGFARSQGVELEDVFLREVEGAEYVFARKFEQGKPALEVLGPILQNVVTSITFPKNMRWGNYDLRYARPLRWIVALFGSEIIDFSVENVRACNVTYGHRQLAKEGVVVNNPVDYSALLEQAFVIADHKRRRALIEEQIQQLAKAQGGKVLLDQKLLDEVTNLVEYPTSFCGNFDADYLEVPKEVLITTMQEHQRYFGVTSTQGDLLPKFIGVRNGADNHLELVIEGNERVLSARLSDARFFYDEDQKESLEKNIDKLKAVVFQEGLGTVYDKVLRLQSLSDKLAQFLNIRQSDAIRRTALLAKADLTTHMVYEFPELQGIMGGEYAKLQGEDEQVVQGILQHYQPKSAGDALPENDCGVVVSLADKLDTLVGYFGLGKIPTGSQDPYALRRQALGVVQILEMREVDKPFSQLISEAYRQYDGLPKSQDEVVTTLTDFFNARIKMLLQDRGYGYDTIDSVLATNEQVVSKIFAKAEAVESFRGSKEFELVQTAVERASNLAEKAKGQPIDESLFGEAEKELSSAISSVDEKVKSLLAKNQYLAALQELAELKKPVDSFFDQVMVMDKDETIRENRLALLRKIKDISEQIAVLGMIVTNS